MGLKTSPAPAQPDLLDVYKRQANELAQALAEKYEDVEVEIHQGGQPVYPYLFSVE